MDFDVLTNILIGVAIGVSVAMVWIWLQFQMFITQIEKIIDKNTDENNEIGLEIEFDNGIYYCYNSKTKQFVCQGANIFEIRKAFQSRFPGYNAYLAGGDPDLIKKFVTELKHNENSSSI